MVAVVGCLVYVMSIITLSSATLCPDNVKWNYPVFWIAIPGTLSASFQAANGLSTRADMVIHCPYLRFPYEKKMIASGYRTARRNVGSSARNSGSTGMSRHGCLVQSTNPISATSYNWAPGGNIEASQFREMKELGLEYYAMTTNPNISTKPQLMIMASLADTKVGVRLPLVRPIFIDYKGTIYTSGDWINDTLRDYDVMKIVTNKIDLTGSYVVSDKPVTVVAGDYETLIEINGTIRKGHVEEAMPPIQELGQDYIAAPVIHENYTCSLRILAVSNDTDETNVTISNTTDSTGFSVTIPFNDVYDYDFNCELQLIRANQNVMVGLFTQTAGIVGGRPAYFVLAPLEKAGNTAWFTVPDYYGLYLITGFEHNHVNIIVKASDASGIRLKNAGITGSFHQDIDVGGVLYSAYSVSVAVSQSYSYYIRHTAGGKFNAYFEARKDDFRTYGYTLIPYQMGSEFLYWDENTHGVSAENVTYNQNLNVKRYETVKDEEAKSFMPTTDTVLSNTNKFTALNKCKKTGCDFVSCTAGNTCTLSYTPHHCQVRDKSGSRVYTYSGKNEESCSTEGP